ncbi:MAG: electron transfer flavoprotein subunit alpha/FixB family protein [Candidatus Neomarinimicrobiota bacterium]
MDILVVLEAGKGSIHRMSLEAVTAAQYLGHELGQKVTALALGKSAKVLAEQASSIDLESVLLVENELISTYSADGYAEAVKQIIEKEKPAYVIFGHTYQVRDYVPKISARLNSPFLADNIGLKIYKDKPVFIKQLFNAKLAAEIEPQTAGPGLISFQSAAFQTDNLKSGSAPIKSVSVDISEDQIKTRSEAPFREEAGDVDLTAADIIVSVGRGIGKEENLTIIYDLAQALKGEVGSSRPVVDSGWLPSSRQIGSSGQTVSPKLYLALGISGSIQHVVGMKGSKKIVAINKDPDAPIFELADYGIVGDIIEIIPKLTDALNS